MKRKKGLLCVVLPLVLLIPLIIKAGSPGLKRETYKNSVGMEFVLIPPGSFKMGLSKEFRSPCQDDMPSHMVTIRKPFYIGKYEVTQEQWLAVMNKNPSKFKGKKHPVERVSWLDAREFIKKLNQMEKTGTYRLPTEAEWEYACRANTKTLYYFGDSEKQLPEYAWYCDKSMHTTHPAGQLKPNAFGLYDTLGNVWEWCYDAYERDYYMDSPAVDPRGPVSGSCRVIRGGSWHSIAPYRLRCSFRFFYTLNGRLANLGFRLVKDGEKK